MLPDRWKSKRRGAEIKTVKCLIGRLGCRRVGWKHSRGGESLPQGFNSRPPPFSGAIWPCTLRLNKDTRRTPHHTGDYLWADKRAWVMQKKNPWKRAAARETFFSVMMTDGFTDVQETVLLCINCSWRKLAKISDIKTEFMQIHLDKLQAELFFLFLCFWACQSENRPISVLWAGGGQRKGGEINSQGNRETEIQCQRGRCSWSVWSQQDDNILLRRRTTGLIYSNYSKLTLKHECICSIVSEKNKFTNFRSRCTTMLC